MGTATRDLECFLDKLKELIIEAQKIHLEKRGGKNKLAFFRLEEAKILMQDSLNEIYK